jgi:deoxyribodipyrimidine photo-lyase
MVTSYEDIVSKVRSFDPTKYGATRNFSWGNVSRLSPYISRGVISTRFVYDDLVERFKDIRPFEKFVQELAWRDYWQRVWQQHDIDEDIKQPQERISHFEMPKAIIDAKTGIEVLDTAIEEMYESGYMHNHMRMYVAAVVCNVGQCYWKEGARWMYAHLKDADWGSNALSWQWVAGSNSAKKYYANQENINKYFKSQQRNTFMDRSYEELMEMSVPDILKAEATLDINTIFPESQLELNTSLPTLIYTQYNLDPLWHKDLEANRVLLLEPDHFKKYPIAQNSLDFIIDVAKNIEGVQLHVGSFDTMEKQAGDRIVFKEHPFSKHFKGEQDARDWIHPEVPLENSFFRYWKELRKQLPEFE